MAYVPTMKEQSERKVPDQKNIPGYFQVFTNFKFKLLTFQDYPGFSDSVEP